MKKIMQNRKIKSFLMLAYWVLYFIIMIFMADYMDMFSVNPETGILEFDISIINIILVVALTVIFFPLSRKLFYHSVYDEPEISEEQEREYGQEYGAEEDVQDTEEPSDSIFRKIKRKLGFVPNPDYESLVNIPKENYSSEYYFRLNDFALPANENRDFLNECYNNMLRIKLPESIHGADISGIGAFYMHFQFSNGKSPKEKIQEDVIRSNIELYQYPEEDGDERTIFIKVPYSRHLGRRTNKSSGLDCISVMMKFQLTDGVVSEVKLELPVNYTIWDTVTDTAKRIFSGDDEKAQNINTAHLYIENFRYTTRTDPLSVSNSTSLTFYDSENYSESYNFEVSCYSNFSTIRCPICSRDVHDLGVPGIVLYRNTSREVYDTSNSIIDYLESLEYSSDPEDRSLLDIVKTAAEQNMINVRGEALSSLKANRGYVRIPLGKHHNGKIVPFTYRDFEEERDFLHKFNRYNCPDLPEPEEYQKDSLCLLKCGKVDTDNISNFYIHNSMTAQLCSSCWNPLPDKFYNYSAVINIYFFGNPNAGKTVLLCSEYNVIKKYFPNQLNKFNNICFEPANRDKSGDDIYDYRYKSEMIAKGIFPPGTTDIHAIPGKLSEFSSTVNGSTKYMFNSFDMPGSQAIHNWKSSQNFAYVHSMLDDPISLGSDSFYRNLIEIIPSGITADARKYNIQIYLTKIDEYPLFLYQEIQKLNSAWTKLNQNSTISSQSIFVYTLKLLQILESGLRDSFENRRADEVISTKIRNGIIKSDSELRDLDFSKTYREIHTQIFGIGYRHKKLTRELKAVFNYLHGLDVIRDNYFAFRQLIYKLLSGMEDNMLNNDYSYYMLCVYAVSATGYSTVESLAPDALADYSPEFVADAHNMMKYATCEFEKELYIPDDTSDFSSRNLMFRDLSLQSFCAMNQEFIGDSEMHESTEKSFCGYAVDMYKANDIYFSRSGLYSSSCEELGEKLKNLKAPDSVSELYKWYSQEHYKI